MNLGPESLYRYVPLPCPKSMIKEVNVSKLKCIYCSSAVAVKLYHFSPPPINSPLAQVLAVRVVVPGGSRVGERYLVSTGGLERRRYLCKEGNPNYPTFFNFFLKTPVFALSSRKYFSFFHSPIQKISRAALSPCLRPDRRSR
jgi:hypothetical protein